MLAGRVGIIQLTDNARWREHADVTLIAAQLKMTAFVRIIVVITHAVGKEASFDESRTVNVKRLQSAT